MTEDTTPEPLADTPVDSENEVEIAVYGSYHVKIDGIAVRALRATCHNRLVEAIEAINNHDLDLLDAASMRSLLKEIAKAERYGVAILGLTPNLKDSDEQDDES